jgi:hypothetical protein
MTAEDRMSATHGSNVPEPARVARWRRAWSSGDAAEVVALYADGATHASPKVAGAMPELARSELRGAAEIERYARRAFARIGTLRVTVLNIASGPSIDFVEYLAAYTAPELEAGARQRVVEVLEWQGERLASVRVYHA